jgi:uncharacterized zinc-type alcohol dehydrogenase-like protein
MEDPVPRNIGYATNDATTPLAPLEFDRPAVGPEDVLIDITHCGVCHSDVHQARDGFDGPLGTDFPCMPGHEIVGTVAEVGSSVTRHAVGDLVGVGCLVYWGAEDQRGVPEEQYQQPPAVFTYDAKDPETGEVTFGGYSDQIVVHEHFVLRIPEALTSEQAAPILCSGVTTWAPLAHFEVGAGQRIGVAGIGGLGHIGLQIAVARGAEVVALTTTAEKAELARGLGAVDAIVMTDEDAVQAAEGSLDFILSTIPTVFDMNPYLSLLRHDGRLHSVGMLEPVHEGGIDFGAVSLKRLSLSGALIGTLAETQEVLDFCAEHGIAPDVEVIPATRIDEAFDAMVANEVRFRYVLDASTLRDGV